MMLGIGIALGATRLVAASTYDPATLNLSGWWRAPYAGSPLNGIASAGSSGGRNLSEATNPPSVGAALNGFDTIDFDGVNDQLTNALAISNYLTASAYTLVVLMNLDAVGGFASPVDAHHLSDSGNFFGLGSWGNSGDKLVAYHWDGASKNVQTAITTGAWQLAQVRFGSGTLEARINNGAWAQTTSVGNLTTLTGTLRVGVESGTVHRTNGRFAEIMLAPAALADADLNNIRSYINTRYALSV